MIVTWNANGLYRRKLELEVFLRVQRRLGYDDNGNLFLEGWLGKIRSREEEG